MGSAECPKNPSDGLLVTTFCMALLLSFATVTRHVSPGVKPKQLRPAALASLGGFFAQAEAQAEAWTPDPRL